MLLYDVNLGFPLLSESARLKFDVKETVPWDDLARQEIDEWMLFVPPTADYVERDFTHVPRVDESGWAKVELENPEMKLGLRLSFDQTTLRKQNALPYLHAGESRNYTLEIEVIEYL
jgi:hypothetical protein